MRGKEEGGRERSRRATSLHPSYIHAGSGQNEDEEPEGVEFIRAKKFITGATHS